VQALAGNPQAIAQSYAFEASQHAVDVATGALLPTVQLNGVYNKIMNETYNGTTIRQEQATLNVQVPLYQSGVEYANIRALKQTASQQQLQLDQVRHDVVQSSASAWDSLTSTRAQVESLQTQVDASQVALDGIQKQYEVGAETILDVLTSAQNLLTAQVNLVRAQHDRTVASYQLRSSIGQLTAQSMKLPVAVYDPTVHYNDVRNSWIGLGGPTPTATQPAGEPASGK
jgi:outer membrane protein